MGTFVSSRQVRQNINLMTPWWLSGASIDLDFDNARYYDSSLGASASLAPLNSYLSISRASTKYAKTAAGVLTSFGNDTLAITDLGLSIEDARTNLVLNSSNLNTSPWAPYQVTNTGGFADPAGGLTAYKSVETAVNDAHQPTGPTTSSITSGTARPFTASIYLKQLSGNRTIRLSHVDQSSNGYLFDIDTSWNVTVTAQGSGASNPSYVLEQLANGWYRLAATVTCSTTATNQRIHVHLGSGTNFVYTGDGASGIYMWGPQIEEAAFASSYIPTSGASATRAADLIRLIGTAQSLWSSAGSLVAYTQGAVAQTAVAEYVIGSGNTLLYYSSIDSKFHAVSGADHATANTTLRPALDKCGYAWSTPNMSAVLNGGTVITFSDELSHTTPVNVGMSPGPDSALYGYFARLALWNSKLADATLQSLTA